MTARPIALHVHKFGRLDDGSLQCELAVVGRDAPVKKFVATDESNLPFLIYGSEFFQLVSMGSVLGGAATLMLFVEIPEDAGLAARVQLLDWESQMVSLSSRVRIAHLPENSQPSETIEIDQPLDVCFLAADDTHIDHGHCAFQQAELREGLVQRFQASELNSYQVKAAVKDRLNLPNDRYWEALILIAHGERPTPAFPSGMIWLNSEMAGTGQSVDSEELAQKLQILGSDCPPVIALLSCHGATPGPEAASFAADLFTRVSGIKLLLAFTGSIPPQEAVDRALDMCSRLSRMKMGDSLVDLASYDGIIGDLPLRVYVRSMSTTVEKTHRSRILVTDQEAMGDLKQSLASLTPPVLVLGSGCFSGYHRKVEKVAEDCNFPLLGWPRRDPADVSLSGGRTAIKPVDDPSLWRSHVAQLFSEDGLDSDGSTLLNQTKLIELIAKTAPPIIFNLSRGRGLYDELKRLGREVKVLFTSPKVPIRDGEQELALEEFVLDAERRRSGASNVTQHHLLIQPFGMVGFKNSRDLKTLDLFDDDDARRFERVQRGSLAGRNNVVCASQVHLLEWLHTSGDTQPNSKGLPSLLVDRMKDVSSGLAFLGVSSELLETKVFLTWLSAELVHRTGSSIDRLYVVQSREAYGMGYCQDPAKARKLMSDLVRYYLAISKERVLFEISTDLESVLRELSDHLHPSS